MNELKKIIESLRTIGHDDPALHIRACWELVIGNYTSNDTYPHAAKLITRIVETVATIAEAKPAEKATVAQ